MISRWIILTYDQETQNLQSMGSFDVEQDPLPGLRKVFEDIAPEDERSFYAMEISEQRQYALYRVHVGPHLVMVQEKS